MRIFVFVCIYLYEKILLIEKKIYVDIYIP